MNYLDELERMIAHGDTAGALRLLRKRKERIDEEWQNAFLSHLIDSKEHELEQTLKLLEWCVNEFCTHHPAAHRMKKVQRIRSLLSENS